MSADRDSAHITEDSARMGELTERVMGEIDRVQSEDSVDLSRPPLGFLSQADLAGSHQQFMDALAQNPKRPGLITDKEIAEAKIQHGIKPNKHR
jgi:hypothetical protein